MQNVLELVTLVIIKITNPNHSACVGIFLSDKRISESSQRTANRRQRPWHIRNRQKHNTSGMLTFLLLVVSRSAVRIYRVPSKLT